MERQETVEQSLKNEQNPEREETVKQDEKDKDATEQRDLQEHEKVPEDKRAENSSKGGQTPDNPEKDGTQEESSKEDRNYRGLRSGTNVQGDKDTTINEDEKMEKDGRSANTQKEKSNKDRPKPEKQDVGATKVLEKKVDEERIPRDKMTEKVNKDDSAKVEEKTERGRTSVEDNKPTEKGDQEKEKSSKDKQNTDGQEESSVTITGDSNDHSEAGTAVEMILDQERKPEDQTTETISKDGQKPKSTSTDEKSDEDTAEDVKKDENKTDEQERKGTERGQEVDDDNMDTTVEEENGKTDKEKNPEVKRTSKTQRDGPRTKRVSTGTEVIQDKDMWEEDKRVEKDEHVSKRTRLEKKRERDATEEEDEKRKRSEDERTQKKTGEEITVEEVPKKRGRKKKEKNENPDKVSKVTERMSTEKDEDQNPTEAAGNLEMDGDDQLDELVTESKQQKSQATTTTDSMLHRLHGDIRISLKTDKPDTRKCLAALDQLSAVYVTSQHVQRHSELVATLRKMRWYRANSTIMDKASMLYNRFKHTYLLGEGEEVVSASYLNSLVQEKEQDEAQHVDNQQREGALHEEGGLVEQVKEEREEEEGEEEETLEEGK
ncbi:PC4 and SFRS1-interacting protein-like isoform X2 [Cynoglossus semilaevis]|uniref:PC4 and SFRS1-interacting protein-like isoform X2 n=1 Tax=Cynoglossus semilaevis TaxID=244447 RepID=UPI000D628668|nr:PC4 and SFRS1-interacting protein-like isoform X2 [Cynoglossus semilaevis]